jgi:hypothetical protein
LAGISARIISNMRLMSVSRMPSDIREARGLARSDLVLFQPVGRGEERVQVGDEFLRNGGR